MVLAAGRGERMRPLTDTLPKPLLSVGGKPLIVWHLERLASWGLRKVVINHAHLGHVLEQSLGDGSQWGLQIAWSPEGEALETAGGIAQALPLLGHQPFLVINGDVFCDLDGPSVVAALAGINARSDAVAGAGGGSDSGAGHVVAPGMTLAHLWLVDNPAHKSGGDFTLRSDATVLPQPDASAGEPLTFSGIGLYSPTLFAGCERGKKAPLAPLLRSAMEEGRVTGERLRGRWVDVGTPQRLAELDAQINARM